jgi:calcium-translocating P-type ATPase
MEIETSKSMLNEIGGMSALLKKFDIDMETGVKTEKDVEYLREKYGSNEFPEYPLKSYWEFLWDAMQDTTLLVLLAAAAVSLIIGIIEEGTEEGWIEGGAIFIAVALVSNITAINDYSKQLQFADLERTQARDEKCTVIRYGGEVVTINPRDIVVGDILNIPSGGQAFADCILLTNIVCISDQSSLTGESEEVKKTIEKDHLLYSSCTVVPNGICRALALGTGVNSQWGKIKVGKTIEHKNTPLQDKLDNMTEIIGYVGIIAAFFTFSALVISIWARDNGENISGGFIHAFILAVTIIVVAIPEGLPLAVTIALAYSQSEMYNEMCNIRVLAACETMGNATNICSDKTGTLTENQMTVVAGWFAGKFYDKEEFSDVKKMLSEKVITCITDQTSLNRECDIRWTDTENKPLEKGPEITGSKTESALMIMAYNWGIHYMDVLKKKFNTNRDKFFPFNSEKKRSTCLIEMPDGTIRIFVKGASEWILKDATALMDHDGNVTDLTPSKLDELNECILSMARQALRTLTLAHVDFPSRSALPKDWMDNPPDTSNLVIDCIVGIIDPLRGDVIEAVQTAKRAGVVVRMITGDNIVTARAIAKDCGILTDEEYSIEGPVFRKLTPKEADQRLLTLEVMARSSPEDKLLLVTRLNGKALPDTQEKWEKRFESNPDYSYDTHKDLLLPGYKEEWELSHPNGGEVVGVTGDGTNDAPALAAADVGLAMGIAGTDVAKGAAAIVILDDRFSSIVNAIKWGRSIYDNIRKFLQFQLTVNIVALVLVFVAAAAGFGQPLTAVQMLWVNLIMDTLGALALGTEKPTDELLNRRPYRRNAMLISRPMMRNMAFQSAFQLILLFTLLFAGASLFSVRSMSTDPCFEYSSSSTATISNSSGGTMQCSDWKDYCNGQGDDCYEESHTNGDGNSFYFSDYTNFKDKCLTCTKHDYTHGTIIFNAFIWCQIFNEYTSRNLLDEWNPLAGLNGNFMFLYVSLFSIGSQIIIVEFGEEFTSTSPLTLNQWLITIALGAIGLLVGVIMRFVPVEEDPNEFFFHEKPVTSQEDKSKVQVGKYQEVATDDV